MNDWALVCTFTTYTLELEQKQVYIVRWSKVEKVKEEGGKQINWNWKDEELEDIYGEEKNF